MKNRPHVFPIDEEAQHVLDHWYGPGTCLCGAVEEDGVIIHNRFNRDPAVLIQDAQGNESRPPCPACTKGEFPHRNCIHP